MEKKNSNYPPARLIFASQVLSRNGTGIILSHVVRRIRVHERGTILILRLILHGCPGSNKARVLGGRRKTEDF